MDFQQPRFSVKAQQNRQHFIRLALDNRAFSTYKTIQKAQLFGWTKAPHTWREMIWNKLEAHECEETSNILPKNQSIENEETWKSFIVVRKLTLDIADAMKNKICSITVFEIQSICVWFTCYLSISITFIIQVYYQFTTHPCMVHEIGKKYEAPENRIKNSSNYRATPNPVPLI